MKKYILKNLNIIGAIFIALGLPIGVKILPNNYDLLFLPIGALMLIVSYFLLLHVY